MNLSFKAAVGFVMPVISPTLATFLLRNPRQESV
jgi:hypothetical protein